MTRISGFFFDILGLFFDFIDWIKSSIVLGTLVWFFGPVVFALCVSLIFHSIPIAMFSLFFGYGFAFASFLGPTETCYQNIAMSLSLGFLYLVLNWITGNMSLGAVGAAWYSIAFCMALIPTALLRRDLFS